MKYEDIEIGEYYHVLFDHKTFRYKEEGIVLVEKIQFQRDKHHTIWKINWVNREKEFRNFAYLNRFQRKATKEEVLMEMLD